MLRTMPEYSLFSDAESSEQARSRAVAWFVKFQFSSWEQIWEHFSELSRDSAPKCPYIEMRARVQTDSENCSIFNR